MTGKTKEIRLTKAELDAMSPEERHELFMRAVKIEGTALVRRADGSIKYDDPPTGERDGESGEGQPPEHRGD